MMKITYLCLCLKQQILQSVPHLPLITLISLSSLFNSLTQTISLLKQNSWHPGIPLFRNISHAFHLLPPAAPHRTLRLLLLLSPVLPREHCHSLYSGIYGLSKSLLRCNQQYIVLLVIPHNKAAYFTFVILHHK